MAAALFRRGTGLCVRCIHRELCRVVWRPQTALFSSKSSDRKQPRRTHIKKAKPQPTLDVAKLLEQLFSQQRPPAGKARPTKAISKPTKPLTTSSVNTPTSNVPPLSKTDPSVSIFAGASSFKKVDSIPKQTTSTFSTAALSPQPNSASPTNPNSSETPQQSRLDFAADSVSNVTVPPASITPASLGSEAAALDGQTLTETHKTSVETAAEPVELKIATVSAATAEPIIETTTVEPFMSPVEVLESKSAVAEAPVESAVDPVPAEEVQAMVDVLQTTKEEPLLGTTIESQVEDSNFPVETLEIRAAVGEGPVESTIDITFDVAAEIKSTDSGVAEISHTEPFLETTVDPSTSPLETLESRAAVAECPVEPTVDATVDAPVQAVQTNSTDPGHITLSHIAENDPLIETTVEPSVEASTFPQETLATAVAEESVDTEVDAAAQTVQTNSTDSEVFSVSYSAKEEPLIETIEPAVEASASLESRACVSEGTVKPTIENEAESLHAQESAPLPFKNEVEPTLESTVESSSGNVAAEEEANKPEKMTLESVTLHVAEAQVESLKIDELHQTKSTLDEKAEEELHKLLVQTGTGVELKAAAETEKSNEDESEVLTEALSKWDSLSEDLQELEGESGLLVKELFCHVPAEPAKAPGTVKASDHPPVGANEESLQTEKEETEAEVMTLESVTLSKVEAEVRGLETDVLLETRNTLEKEAEVQAKEEKTEVKTTVEEDVFEDTTEAEILNLDSISEATDAIEAETSVLLEAMFGSEQGPRQPPDTLLVEQKLGQQDKVIDQEAEKKSGDQEESVLEAMTLESVTLAEVEASLGTLENESLSETTDYLEKEAEILAGEKKIEVEDGVASEETTEAVDVESLSLPEDDALSEVLQTDALIQELLFSVPGHVTKVTEGHTGQEDVATDILDAVVDTGSADVDSVAAVTSDFQDSAALTEELLGQEVEKEEAQTEALGNEDGKGTHTDFDPVQRLFLDKIREYNNMRRLKGGLLEKEPDYEKHLSEETAKLQRLYGGGDLSSFPEFTFTEPELDQDTK